MKLHSFEREQKVESPFQICIGECWGRCGNHLKPNKNFPGLRKRIRNVSGECWGSSWASDRGLYRECVKGVLRVYRGPGLACSRVSGMCRWCVGARAELLIEVCVGKVSGVSEMYRGAGAVRFFRLLV